MRIGEKRKIFDGKYLKVWETEFYDKNGKKQTWEWLEKKDAVFIFPITSNRKIILIKNFRIPVERYVIEMPAGLKDKVNESDIELAGRELLEETGYSAKTFIPVQSWPYRSGSSDGISKGFIATGLLKIKEEVGDETEDISVVEVKADELFNFYFNLPNDVLFDIGILAMYGIASKLGLI